MTKNMKIGLVITGIILIAFLMIGGGALGALSSLKTDGVRMEQGMSASYDDNQNYLSAYIVSFHEQFGLTRMQTAAGDTILLNAMRGRYGANGFSPNGAFFSAIHEAYPDVASLTAGYGKLMTFVQSGRDQFRARQSRIRDVVRDYDSWLNEGLFRPVIISFLGFPSKNLKARIGGTVVATGPAALEQFHKLVLDPETNAAFTTGTQQPLVR